MSITLCQARHIFIIYFRLNSTFEVAFVVTRFFKNSNIVILFSNILTCNLNFFMVYFKKIIKEFFKMLTIEQMTPEQKIGRVMCARRFREQEDIDFTLELVKNQACGALMLPFNETTKDLVKLFRDAAEYPVIIVNDMETKFPLSSTPFVPLMSLSACNNLEYIRAFSANLAKEARECGFSGAWGPVVDLQRDNGIYNCSVGRAFTDNPLDTTALAEEIIKVYDSYNFHATGKHYPGGKRVYPRDTHMVEGISEDTEEDLLNDALIPYIELIKKGLMPAIMSGHVVYKNIDPDHPASLSKKVIDIIRKQGFDGVMYTDSLAMMGICQKYGDKKAMALGLMAGNDIILPNYRIPTKTVYNMMVESYYEGDITDEALNEAVRRVMKLEEYCAKEPTTPYPVPENINEILENIARDCITADCAEGYTPAIDTEKSRLFAVVVPEEYAQGHHDVKEVGGEISMKGWYSPERISGAIKERFPSAQVEFIREYPVSRDNDRVLNAATKYDEVVFVTYCTCAPYLGSDCMTRRMESVITALALPKKLCALVHFGNPLALENIEALENVPRIIYGYKSPNSQIYAFDVLAGKIEAKGTLPYKNISKFKR